MAASLSAYWVKFFKGAGFSQDVATKHAVVFSNNRIKPDMLPDLDKPSLKEMGITLMGDMIAILRYAKKVVEETTCERFLVDSEDTLPTPKISVSKPIMKKGSKEIGNKSMVLAASKTDSKKIVKSLSATKKILTIRKPISVPVITNAVNQKPISVKRKLTSEEVYQDNDEDNWNISEKKVKTTNGSEDNTEYTVATPKTTTVRTQILKKPVEQKRTVFDRLGDSSVTSTTNLVDTTPTFNITGVSKEVFKRSTSVFKRLGDIDDKKDQITFAGILKNGSSITSTPGILKNRTLPSVRTSIITTKRVPKITGTMHADHEVNKKIILNNTSRILKLKKEVPNVKSSIEGISKKISTVTSGKLASERLVSIPAKARLGTTTAKQVTFSKVATVTHVKRADVFSRLGI
ncbi:PREDICTED: uncharacterized protein C19orf47 homolog isoform X1 [Acromyrmex echinatior]|uniref:Uncharacterized protein C19orf47-like protein n=1 Tax=Acromyrmex echinatior TaxID=103372 RepID=F4X154_ACREC|nr:PREDICTED: uncharacterized protein C19orf47 homolog isoform X1 [Acromyrmex echinatior]EGI59821.1 Uncharacterized protein C19orf47-like protein [Acromyrmex echinatior]